jgi:prolyl-tRNA editing enzyme YbaK/EbsC (Cys-tRNA(Pro) deacylase)
MSKSLKRVEAALTDADINYEMVRTETASRTAQAAADVIGCSIDQIAKSIILRGQDTQRLYLFVTAGGNQVCLHKASDLVGEPIDRPNANTVRKVTGFAVGGVSPVGHITPIRAFIDPRLADFEVVWAAGGTPNHVFSIAPDALIRTTGGKITDFSS